MNYSKKFILDLANKYNFIASNVEKVVRLLDVLDFIFGFENRPMFILKGGTAINLLFTNLSRLSTDIDLDFVLTNNLEEIEKERKNIIKKIDDFIYENGYKKSQKCRESKILTSLTYSYTNSFGNLDNIKIELNFIDRVHITYPYLVTQITYFNKSLQIFHVSKEELYGMKIAALIDRNKPRDLYDVYNISKDKNINFELLRKCFIFYLSLDRIFEVNDSVINRVDNITQNEIKKELYPVLSKSDKFKLSDCKKDVLIFLDKIVLLEGQEKEYLINFQKGNFSPQLLFEKEHLKSHPMALWICKNKNK